jgi:hypothetical protein
MVHYSTSKRAIMGCRRKAIKAQGAVRCEPSFKFQSPRKSYLLLLEEGQKQEFKTCSYSSSSSSAQESLLLDFSKRFLLEENITKKSTSSTGMISRSLVRVKTTKVGTIFSTSTSSTTDDFPKINWILEEQEDDTSACGMDFLFNVETNMGSGVLTQKQKVGAGQSGDKLNLHHLSGASTCVLGRGNPFLAQRKVVNHQPTAALARSKSLRLDLSYLADEQVASTFFALIL